MMTILDLCNLALDEAHGLRPILLHILLVSIRVVPIATVRIWPVAVRSDLAGGCAAEAPCTSSKLETLVLEPKQNDVEAYAFGLAGPNIVGKTSNVSWVSHKDGSLDRVQGVTGKSLTGASAESIIHDLPILGNVSPRYLLLLLT
jgi:hypothetical protein